MTALLLSPLLVWGESRVETFHNNKHYIKPYRPQAYIYPHNQMRPRPHYRHRGHKRYSSGPRNIAIRPHRYNTYPHRGDIYHDGYYRPYYADSCAPRYRPMYHTGEMLRYLPYGAREVFIDEIRYYRYNEYYFQPHRRNGVTMYVVVHF